MIDDAAAAGGNLAVTSGRDAVERAAEPLEARNIVHVERGGRFRVRERTVLRYYARTLSHLLAPARVVRLACTDGFRFEGNLPCPCGQQGDEEPCFPVRTAAERSFARRFVAGETVADAIAAARRIEAAGMSQTLDFLGESVATMAEADRGDARLPRNDQRDRRGGHRPQPLAEADPARADRRPRDVRRQPAAHPRRATPHDFFVRIDMEDSRYTQVTFDIFETLWQQGYRNAGMVVQSYLPRSSRTRGG